MFLLSLLAALPAQSTQSQPALLVHGGTIHSGDARDSRPAALLAENGVIVAGGAYEDVNRHPAAAVAQRLDLQGAVAVPGLQDAHVDLQAMVESRSCIEFSAVVSAQDLLERVRAAAASLPEGTWILGRGLDPAWWEDPRLPLASELSLQSPFHPLCIWFRGGDGVLVNSRALVLAGLDGPLNPPPRIIGGRIVLAADGSASGVLVGAARELVRQRIQPPLEAAWESSFPAVESELLSYGLTCVHDLGTSQEFLRFLEERRARQCLRLRIVSYPSLGLEPLALQVGPRREDAPQDRLSVPGVHLALDGGLGLRNAALLENYEGAGIGGSERGVLLIDEDRLAGRLMDSARQGLEPCIEVHGDRAARAGLDAWDRLCASMPEARSLSLRIQGLDLAAPRDWPRLSQRHVATGLEPLRAWLGSDVQAARIGARRVEEQLGWRQLSARNQRLVLGSGAAQAAWADPRRTLFAACGDAPRGMSLDPGTALQAMTRTPGLISGQGARRGSLEVGRSLDLTVFQQDPLRTPSERLLKLEVLYTVINGELVHSLR